MKFSFDSMQVIIDSLNHPFQLSRALFWRLAKRLNFVNESENTSEDQKQDRILPFDEHPPCEICNGNSFTEKLVTMDGSHIVECENCGLWFTNPRIDETLWVDYLKTNTKRNIEFTENRLKFGCALSANVKYSFPGWRKVKTRLHNKIFNAIEDCLGRDLGYIHDVGCGIGALMQDAADRGIVVSGNELNVYAYKVMKERLGLDVYNDTLPDIDLQGATLDAIIMHDYIEHTYHPLADLKVAFTLLKEGGIIYIETFHIDCAEFDRLKGNWNMLFWNHVYHFSQRSLGKMVKTAGFELVKVQADYDNTLIKVIARKP